MYFILCIYHRQLTLVSLIAFSKSLYFIHIIFVAILCLDSSWEKEEPWCSGNLLGNNFFFLRKGMIFKGRCIKQHFFKRDGEKENFPRPLKLIMKASPHDHFSGESAGSAPVPSKGSAEQGDLDSSFLFLTFYVFFPLCPFYNALLWCVPFNIRAGGAVGERGHEGKR